MAGEVAGAAGVVDVGLVLGLNLGMGWERWMIYDTPRVVCMRMSLPSANQGPSCRDQMRYDHRSRTVGALAVL